MSTFTYKPAEDESVDSEYVLDTNPNVTIQDARTYGGGWCVNEWLPDEEAMLDHGSFRTLDAAKTAALAVISKPV